MHREATFHTGWSSARQGEHTELVALRCSPRTRGYLPKPHKTISMPQGG